MKQIIDVKPISQLFPKPLIMGCEGVAAAMLLQHNQHDITAVEIMKNWPRHNDNPEIGYVGHPLLIKPKVHQTIFPRAFVPYLQQYDEQIIDGTGTPLSELEEVMQTGQPVILYHTHLGLRPSIKPFQTSDGIKHWVSNIHITLLVGYDDDFYYYIDPLWQHLGKILFPAVIPGKRQIFKMKKTKLEQSYDSPGRLSIYKKS